MENPVTSKIEFPAKINRTKKGHWYITVPTVVKESIEWKKEKLFKVSLEKF